MLFKFFEVKIDITFPVVNKFLEFVKQYELTLKENYSIFECKLLKNLLKNDRHQKFFVDNDELFSM